MGRATQGLKGWGWGEKVVTVMRDEEGMGQDKTMQEGDEDLILRSRSTPLPSLEIMATSLITHFPQQFNIYIYIYIYINPIMVRELFIKRHDSQRCVWGRHHFLYSSLFIFNIFFFWLRISS